MPRGIAARGTNRIRMPSSPIMPRLRTPSQPSLYHVSWTLHPSSLILHPSPSIIRLPTSIAAMPPIPPESDRPAAARASPPGTSYVASRRGQYTANRSWPCGVASLLLQPEYAAANQQQRQHVTHVLFVGLLGQLVPEMEHHVVGGPVLSRRSPDREFATSTSRPLPSAARAKRRPHSRTASARPPRPSAPSSRSRPAQLPPRERATSRTALNLVVHDRPGDRPKSGSIARFDDGGGKEYPK